MRNQSFSELGDYTVNKIKSFLKNDDRALTILILPALILMVLLVFIPLASGLNISFTNWNGYSQKYKYIGFENYIRLLSDKVFHKAFINTLIYGFGSTIIQTILGLAYALLLCKKFMLRTITRTIVYLPAMVAQLIVGYIWYFMVKYDGGALNDIMLLFGMEPLDWMAVGIRAVIIITFINAIEYVGKTMIIFIAGLENIPVMYYEAASIDGANSWYTFRKITFPLLIPAITTSLVLNIIGGLKLFGIIVSMTSGGPGYSSHSLSSLINSMYFGNQDAGYAAAIGMFTFIFIMFVIIITRIYLNKKEVSYN